MRYFLPDGSIVTGTPQEVAELIAATQSTQSDLDSPDTASALDAAVVRHPAARSRGLALVVAPPFRQMYFFSPAERPMVEFLRAQPAGWRFRVDDIAHLARDERGCEDPRAAGRRMRQRLLRVCYEGRGIVQADAADRYRLADGADGAEWVEVPRPARSQQKWNLENGVM